MSLLDDWDEDDVSSSRVAHYDAPGNPFGGVGGMGMLSQGGYSEPVSRVIPRAMAPKVEEQPCPFSLAQAEWQAPGHDKIRFVAASNNVIAVACGECTVHVIDAITWSTSEVDLSRNSTVHKLFLDSATGHHLIICLRNGENFYIHTSSLGKARPIFTKHKPLTIESVAWDRQSITSASTGEVLLGSLKGQIYETQIVDGKEKYVRQVYVLPEKMAVFGLAMERSPTDASKFFVMAATSTESSMQQYQFVGEGSIADMFSQYTQPTFNEIPGTMDHSELHFFSKRQGSAKTFAWLTAPGIYYGDLSYGSQVAHDTVTGDCAMLMYPPSSKSAGSFQYPAGPITAFTRTDFHFVLLLPTAILAINQVTEQTVWSQDLLQLDLGMPLGVARDPFDNKAYLYTHQHLMEIRVQGEDRDMWRVYLKKNHFDTALSHCKSDAQRDKVHCAKADFYFKQNKLDMAAQFYALTSKPFEEVALKFVSQPTRDALKTFLLHKLERISEKDVTQQVLLCTWLVELYLNKLNKLSDDGQMEQYVAVKDDLEEFMEKWSAKGRLNKRTTYHLITSQGRPDVLLFFATLIKDYDRVVQYHVQHKEWRAAVDVLKHQGEEELWYKFSPTLMENAPSETVDGWLSVARLDPRRLIPSLMRYKVELDDADASNEAIRYLQQCVDDGVTDEAVLNYLLALYAKQDDDTQLMDFLHQTAPENYDLKYALRVCTKENRYRACVHIYLSLEMYEEAVELALRVADERGSADARDYELAKQCADGPMHDDVLKKKLWLRIAKHVVNQSDHKKAIEFLEECPLLKIEDILPFFPDFVRIDLFKDEVCASLREYNTQIRSLKADMDEATRNASQIRDDINDLRNRYTFLSANQKCELSRQPVLGKPFYCFRCQHVFLQEVLIKEVLPHLSPEDSVQVNELQSAITRATAEQGRGGDAMISSQQLQELRTKLDNLVASECPLCGVHMINSVDKPLDSDYSSTWDITTQASTQKPLAGAVDAL